MGRVSPRVASSSSQWPDGGGFRGVFWVGRIFFVFFSFLVGPFFAFRAKKPLHNEAVFCL